MDVRSRLTQLACASQNLVNAKRPQPGEEGVHVQRGISDRSFVASAVVGARFLPVWLATGVLAIVAAFIAPNALKSTSWTGFVLPYATVLAIAALGQMLVIMNAGIDLSTPGVMALGGNLIAGIGAGSDHNLAPAIVACLGFGIVIGFVNGVFVGILRLNPLIVTLAVGQIALAWSGKYSREHVVTHSQVPTALWSWAYEKPLGISYVFWTGAALTLAVAFLVRYTAAGRRFQAVGANPRAAWMAGLRVRTHVVFAYAAAGFLYACAAVLFAGIRINVDPAFGTDYLLAPIAAVVIAGASLSGGLASATSTWIAALALTLLPHMLRILGLKTAMQFIVFGGAIIVGMLISGDRFASLLGRALRPIEARAAGLSPMNQPTS